MYVPKLYKKMLNWKLVIGAVFLNIFTHITLPKTDFFQLFIVALVADFLTGVYKAWHLKQPITSKKMRESVAKFVQYAFAIIGLVLLAAFATGNLKNNTLSLFIDGMYLLFTLIETKSCFENLDAIGAKNQISKYFIKPILKLLSIGVDQNKPGPGSV
jgi:phage-related holin